MSGISYSAIGSSSVGGDFESMMKVSAPANSSCSLEQNNMEQNSSDFVVQNNRAISHLLMFPARVPFLDQKQLCMHFLPKRICWSFLKKSGISWYPQWLPDISVNFKQPQRQYPGFH